MVELMSAGLQNKRRTSEAQGLQNFASAGLQNIAAIFAERGAGGANKFNNFFVLAGLAALVSVFFGMLVAGSLFLIDYALRGDSTTLSNTTMSVPEAERQGKGAEAGLTMNETTINICKVLMGVCFVGLPCAIGQGGLLCAILLVLVVFINGFTAGIIIRLLDVTEPHASEAGVPASARDWPFLGYVAFGEAGKAFFSVIFAAELWFALVFCFVINGVNLHLLFPELDLAHAIVLCGVVSFPTLFLSPSWLVYSSALGVIAALLSLVSLLWSANVMQTWESNVGPVALLKWDNITYAVGVFQSCVGLFHPLIPSVYHGMSNPKKDCSPATIRGFALTLSIFMCIAFITFFVYGPQAQPSFLENLGRDLELRKIPGAAFLYIICTGCYTVSVQTSFPLIAAPVVAFFEKTSGTANSHWVVRAAWKFMLISMTTLIAAKLNGCLSLVQSLYGTLLATTSCIVLPVLCSLRLMTTRISIKVLMCVALLYAAYILIYGTYLNVVQVHHYLSASH